MDVSVAEWLAWPTSNCRRIGAIGSSPSNGLKPNMWSQKGFNPLCQCIYIYVCIVNPDIQTIHRCSHTSIHTYIHTYITYAHTMKLSLTGKQDLSERWLPNSAPPPADVDYWFTCVWSWTLSSSLWPTLPVHRTAGQAESSRPAGLWLSGHSVSCPVVCVCDWTLSCGFIITHLYFTCHRCVEWTLFTYRYVALSLCCR